MKPLKKTLPKTKNKLTKSFSHMLIFLHDVHKLLVVFIIKTWKNNNNIFRLNWSDKWDFLFLHVLKRIVNGHIMLNAPVLVRSTSFSAASFSKASFSAASCWIWIYVFLVNRWFFIFSQLVFRLWQRLFQRPYHAERTGSCPILGCCPKDKKNKRVRNFSTCISPLTLIFPYSWPTELSHVLKFLQK